MNSTSGWAGPHSRACGIVLHDHGPACSRDCPTCLGDAARPGVHEPAGWLDPEPPHAEHTEVECRGELPKIRQQDHGRRFRCGTCGRVYRAEPGDQREPGSYWTVVRDEAVGGRG